MMMKDKKQGANKEETEASVLKFRVLAMPYN